MSATQTRLRLRLSSFYDTRGWLTIVNETKQERKTRNKKKNKRVSHLLSLVRVKLRKGKDKHGQTVRHADKQSQ